MAINPSCSTPGDHCSDGGRIVRGLCVACYKRDRRHGDPSVRQRTRKGEAAEYAAWAATYTGDDCLPWPFSLMANGYGTLVYQGKRWSAHRLVLALSTGEAPPDGLHACHAAGICHNRACVNPKHLRWGTRLENMADALIDGTRVQGERVGNSKLKAADIHRIRHVDHRSDAAVAAELGVSRPHITGIRNYTVWKHLP